MLNDLGIAVAFKAIVGDHREELASQVAHALSRHRIVILTGGLGPTDDDLTRDVVAAHLGWRSTRIRPSSRQWSSVRGARVDDAGREPAAGHGAAWRAGAGRTRVDRPRLWIEAGERIALLPGPPREMRPMMNGAVRDRLARLAGGRRLSRPACE